MLERLGVRLADPPRDGGIWTSGKVAHRMAGELGLAFVSPATGESFWYVSNGVCKPFFEALRRLFAEEAGAGRERIIIKTAVDADLRC